MSKLPDNIFVTVGTTRFDDLAQSLLASPDSLSSPPVIALLAKRGVKAIRFQYGNSTLPHLSSLNRAQRGSKDDSMTVSGLISGILFEAYQFKPTTQEDVNWAGMIISHAGSGSMLDALQNAKPLVVVVNNTLADNHQRELALAVAKEGQCIATEPSRLLDTLSTFDPTSLEPFGASSPSIFASIVDDLMGYDD
ncbi:N-acetylglucosaminyldiphosphodolichol N-acetylglucosaminyltransferase catalytic subunit alg13 [Gonapodya sp. JEL0774]|nr:N-acetylglucosaminyldiphosphodolichol N-acetylglucosaminyltransferase catalytic subunit alg13 [Gonapodya sp. JEL0774]